MIINHLWIIDEVWPLRAGWSFVPNTWEFGAPCNDGEGPWSIATAHVKESRVGCPTLDDKLFPSPKCLQDVKFYSYFCTLLFSRHAEKYVRRGRLDWPEGADSRDSIKAVQKLPRLQVCLLFNLISFYWYCLQEHINNQEYPLMQNLIMQHVDHSAGDLIHLLQGLLRYDPSERLTAREALRHSFFSKDNIRR